MTDLYSENNKELNMLGGGQSKQINSVLVGKGNVATSVKPRDLRSRKNSER